MNEEGLREKYALLSGHASVQFSGLAASSTVKTVRGFFDFSTNTIYCPKMNFEVCGHELHHAIIGRFHSDN